MTRPAKKPKPEGSLAKLRALHANLHASVVKALGHPKRLMIVHALADGRERSVSELQAIVKAHQSNMSQNLAILRDAGLVTSRREGNVIYYRIRDNRVTDAIEILGKVADDAQRSSGDEPDD